MGIWNSSTYELILLSVTSFLPSRLKIREHYLESIELIQISLLPLDLLHNEVMKFT